MTTGRVRHSIQPTTPRDGGGTGPRRSGAGATDSAEPHPAWHQVPVEEVLAYLGTTATGLTMGEARRRLGRFGRNELSPHSEPRLLCQFLRQFTHLMALLLWTGAAIAAGIGLPQLAAAIVAVILINGVFSFWQEYRAERASEELARLLPQWATVLRDGTADQVPVAEVVPGDVLLLSEGDAIPADARLLEAHFLSTGDAALTGESTPVPRHAEASGLPTERFTEAVNCVFAGTTIASGRGVAVVIATGERTAYGGIARLTRLVRERPSPLQREMDTAVRAISLVAVGVGVVFTLLALALVHLDTRAALTFSLGLIVAFVPEGLLPTLTLSLAMAVQRMARRRALVKHLAAVEALGAATVIATDKTGVLTENRMTVVALYAGGEEVEVTGSGYAPAGELRHAGEVLTVEQQAALKPLLRVAALCNYARLKGPREPGQPWEITGDPTEGALQALAAKGGVQVEELLGRRRLAAEWPFDARRQRMTVAYPGPAGLAALTKGSPAAVLECCTHLRDAGVVRPLTPADCEEIEQVRRRFAGSGLRVLALAERPLDHADLDRPAAGIERDLIFLGIVAMHDPPRAEVPEAVERCRQAGIRTVIISGDQGSTVAAIGRQVGILTTDNPRVIEGSELAALNGSGLQAVLASGEEVVFARTSPEGKLSVVRAFQALGHVVAVTGDGVNDAPALRQADIGVAMGRSGTDVARASADIVLADDNFASIVAAVEEGRTVFDNIRKFTTYCFTSNTAEAVPFILFLLSAGQIPLALPIMLVLAVDLGTDMFPALALGGEAAEPDVMNRPPRARGAHLISVGLLLRSLLWLGLLEGVAGMAAFFWVYSQSSEPLYLERARAAAFAGIVATQVANVFVCRSERGLAFVRPWNPLLLVGLAAEILLLLLVVYNPGLQQVFGTAAMTLRDWVVPLAALPVFFAAEELRKAFLSRAACRAPHPRPTQIHV